MKKLIIMRMFALLALASGCVHQTLAQGAGAGSASPLDLPSFQLEILTKVWRHDHPGFPTTAVRLGDINGDGYDDFAMTSLVDTVFIFFGGDSLDSELDGYVLGGSNGAVAADFNGDGIIDLATAASNLNRLGEPDSMRYGKIRVYYGSTAPPYFGPEPDMVLRGTKERDDYGVWHSSGGTGAGLISLDINGDRQKDLMFRRKDWRDARDWELAVLFGGAEFDTTVDLCIQKPIVNGIQSYFSEHVLHGDLDGDGRDDLLVYYLRPAVPGKEQFLVYLGKTGGNYWSPDFILENGATFFPRRYQSDITDANGDGYADIVTASGLLFRGFHLFMGSE
ncbi:MAG: VCBS repeat-containing protein, partial [Bacteroidetes bacterium]|nr:VCBS repeat-containing protein [Bacteroidota bacterium]